MEIIVKVNDKYQILKIDLHEYIKFYSKNNNKFMIFQVTEEEYEIMKEQIKDGYLNKRNTEDFIEYDKLKYMIIYNEEKNNIVVDNYNIEVDYIDDYLIGTYMVNADGFHPFNEKKDIKKQEFYGTKIYTTDRYEDVIVHYYHELMDKKYKKIADKIFATEGELTDQEIEFFVKCITNQNCVNCSDKGCKVKTIKIGN